MAERREPTSVKLTPAKARVVFDFESDAMKTNRLVHEYLTSCLKAGKLIILRDRDDILFFHGGGIL